MQLARAGIRLQLNSSLQQAPTQALNEATAHVQSQQVKF
jgi:hypothetical protein